MNPVYLDFAATEPLRPEVLQTLQEVGEKLMRGELGNPSALHAPGQRAAHLLESSRAKVAQLIGADADEIIFTSGGSEANNMVMHTFAGSKIAVSAIEHPSVLESARNYARELTILPVDQQGIITEKVIDADLVSVMLANNEVGTVQPIAELHAKSIHTDATQAVGKVPISVHDLGVDYLTFSAHKIGGPVGIGALYVRRGAKISPLIFGGHQERRLRAGTANVLLAAGFAKAAELADPSKYQEVRTLRDELGRRILAEIPYSSINTPLRHSLPNILNASFQAAEGESIQLYLDAAGIAVSTGSACAAGDLKPSHVLMSMYDDAVVAHNSIRFSLSPKTSAADIDRVMEVLPGIVSKLQKISTMEIKS